MTTTQVRAHERRKPDRTRNDPFKEAIEARKMVLAARLKARDEWYRGPGYPGVFRAVADAFRQFIAGGKQT